MLIKNSTGQLSVAALIQITLASSNEPKAGDIIPGEFIIELKKNAELDARKHSQWAQAIHEKSTTNAGNYTGLEEILKYGDYEGYIGSYEDSTVELIRNHTDTKSVIQNVQKGNETIFGDIDEVKSGGPPSREESLDLKDGKADATIVSKGNGKSEEPMSEEEKKEQDKLRKQKEHAEKIEFGRVMSLLPLMTCVVL